MLLQSTQMRQMLGIYISFDHVNPKLSILLSTLLCSLLVALQDTFLDLEKGTCLIGLEDLIA
jgi:hypothetical protein